MSPNWAALSLAEREARTEAQCAAAVEDSRLEWISATAEAALCMANSDRGAAIALLQLAIGELELPRTGRGGGD